MELDHKELEQVISEKLKQLQDLNQIWEVDKTDPSVWFDAVSLMSEIAPLVEELRQMSQIMSGETYLN